MISYDDEIVKWCNIDYSGNEAQEQILDTRFESSEMCQQFFNVVQMLQDNMTAVIDEQFHHSAIDSVQQNSNLLGPEQCISSIENSLHMCSDEPYKVSVLGPEPNSIVPFESFTTFVVPSANESERNHTCHRCHAKFPDHQLYCKCENHPSNPCFSSNASQNAIQAQVLGSNSSLNASTSAGIRIPDEYSELLNILKFDRVGNPLDKPFANFAHLDQRLVHQLQQMCISKATQSQQQILQCRFSTKPTFGIVLHMLNELTNPNKRFAFFGPTNIACLQAYKLALALGEHSGIAHATDFCLQPTMQNVDARVIFGTSKDLIEAMGNTPQRTLIFDDADVYIPRTLVQNYIRDHWILVKLIVSPLKKIRDLMKCIHYYNTRDCDTTIVRPLVNPHIKQYIISCGTKTKIQIIARIEDSISGQMIIFCKVLYTVL